MKVSAILKGSIGLLGLVGASNFLVAPANADQAAARAAVSVTRPSSLTESISGEVLLPDGYYFTGPSGATLTVTPVYTNPGTTSQSASSLSFNAGGNASTGTPGSLSAAVVAILRGANTTPGVNAVTIDDASAIIKAAAGVDGLE
ncbi:hypothetical protein [Nostoc sp. MG11]|uniref:hypothetical protein n=1 Tax=Nostoc sp. MG11 TaxID=2721166 RepID=UPI0018669397|nr:hypothetical protein [Nostoc sp. MG11]